MIRVQDRLGSASRFSPTPSSQKAKIYTKTACSALGDIMMPGVMDGLQVLDVIKSDSRFKEIFVGMMTTRGQIKDGAIAKKRGADAYFVKPLSPRDVVAWVDSMLQSTRQ